MRGEKWHPLDGQGYPGYSVSNMGRIANDVTNRVLALSRNQQGYVKVSLVNQDGVRDTLQVNHLVAWAFMDPHPEPAFDSLIHLNGDKDHTFVENLAWRPRWFSLKYHVQFDDRKPFVPEPVELVETGEVFEDSRAAAKKYGVLEKDIFLSTCNNSKVFPIWKTFRIVRYE